MTAPADDAGRTVGGATHDPDAGGRPRLIFSTGGALPSQAGITLERGEVELTQEVTTVGSAADADLRLTGIDAHHAEIVHDEFDEYVFIQRSEQATTTVNGERMGRRPLRTGDRIELGPWVLSYYREEFADHGRPFGGRQGGEGAVQPGQQARSEVGTAKEPTPADLQTVVDGPGEHRGRELDV
jgi:hypothetical protein